MRALVCCLLTASLAAASLGSCDHEEEPQPLTIDGGWVGELSEPAGCGIINASINQEEGVLSGVWVVQLARGILLRGDVAGSVSGGTVNLELVQDDPCAGSYTATFNGSENRLDFMVAGADCDRPRTLLVSMAGFQGTIGDPCGNGPVMSPSSGSPRLTEDLAAGAICLGPAIFPPSPAELAALQLRDDQRRAQLDAVGRHGDHDGFLGQLLGDVGACVRLDPARGASFDLLAATNAGGGLAGHGFMVMDGKYVDILREYSTWLAAREAGLVPGEPVFALDEIVPAHNVTAGSFPDGLLYLRSAFPPDVRARAQELERSLVAAITYHEFGHVFTASSLINLRASVGALPPGLLYTSLTEDLADLAAGNLLAKEGLDLGLARDAYDILAYYATQRVNPAVTMNSILSPSGQQTGAGPGYSSIGVRKQTLAQGYADMQEFLSTVTTNSVASAPRLLYDPSLPSQPVELVLPACCSLPTDLELDALELDSIPTASAHPYAPSLVATPGSRR